MSSLRQLVCLADTNPFCPIGHAVEHVVPESRKEAAADINTVDPARRGEPIPTRVPRMDVIGAEAKALLVNIRELGYLAGQRRDIRQLLNELEAAGQKADRILRATHYQGVLNEAEKEASDQAPAARG